MKKAFLAMFMLAYGICAIAQTASSGDSMKHGKLAGKKTTLTGCIIEKDGKYLIADEKHPDGVELATAEDLKPHVGHKVRVTGTMDNSMAYDKMSHDAMAKDDKMSHDSMAMGHSPMALNVSKFEMRSATCTVNK